MKFTVLLASLASVAPLASAWQLELFTTDGRHATMHGFGDSGCINLSFSPALRVQRAKFEGSSLGIDDTFELYVNRGCSGLSYRNGEGNHQMTPRTIRSYKVH
ncbi:hypothetical protein VTH82DRAFT_5418 [Thermothelomyces myriococcoides]